MWRQGGLLQKTNKQKTQEKEDFDKKNNWRQGGLLKQVTKDREDFHKK